MTNQHATKPILFSGPMVSALLAGRKTQTRRLLKLAGRRPDYVGPRGCQDDPQCWGWEHSDGGYITIEGNDCTHLPGWRNGWRDWRGAYATGDRLYVREAWSGIHAFSDTKPVDRHSFVGDGWPYLRDEIWYWADGSPERGDWEKPRPSIHMPRWASRLTLIVTDVRVQRLQDISEAEAVAEGCLMDPEPTEHGDYMPAEIAHEMGGDVGWDSARDWFADLWDSLHGPDAWEANPWIVALTFDWHRGNIDEIASKL